MVVVALFGVFFFDELATGVAPADASRIALDLGAAPGQLAGAVIAAYYAIAVLVEPSLLRWTDRVAPRRALLLGLGALLLVTLGASLSATPASGVATTVAEGALVAAHPTERERVLARAHLAGGLGDLLVPVLLWAVAWRPYFRCAAGLALVLAVLVFVAPPFGRADDDEEDDEDPPRLRDAVRNRGLVGWTLVASLANTMDEVLTAFLAVFLHARSAGDVETVALGVAAMTVGGLGGLAVLDRLLSRFRPLALLAGAAGIALVAFGLVLAIDDRRVMLPLLVGLGAAVATFHPIVSARTYAALPQHPGVVNAVGVLFVPFDAIVPLGLGLLADAAGASAAIAALGVVPAVMLGIALRMRRTDYPRRERCDERDEGSGSARSA